MNDYTQDERDQIQIALCGLWQVLNPNGSELPIETQRGYKMAFLAAGLTVEEIKRATGMALTACKWFPKPVELIEMVQGSVESRALVCWELANRYVRDSIHLRVSSIDLGDPAGNAALRSIGAAFLSTGTESEHERFTRPRFIEAFKTFAATGVENRPVKCLGGSKPPLLLGNAKKTQKIESNPSSEVKLLESAFKMPASE